MLIKEYNKNITLDKGSDILKFIIRGKSYNVKKEEVLNSMMNTKSEKILNYFVKVGDKIYPPKQVINDMFKIHKLFFTTIDAIKILKELGFEIGWWEKENNKLMIIYNGKSHKKG